MIKKSLIFLGLGSSLLLVIKIVNSININSKKNVKGIIFGPTGVNFSYQLGITKYIQENFYLNNLKFCGISGGCQSAFLLSNNFETDYIFREFVLKQFNINNKKMYNPDKE